MTFRGRKKRIWKRFENIIATLPTVYNKIRSNNCNANDPVMLFSGLIFVRSLFPHWKGGGDDDPVELSSIAVSERVSGGFGEISEEEKQLSLPKLSARSRPRNTADFSLASSKHRSGISLFLFFNIDQRFCKAIVNQAWAPITGSLYSTCEA